MPQRVANSCWLSPRRWRNARICFAKASRSCCVAAAPLCGSRPAIGEAMFRWAVLSPSERIRAHPNTESILAPADHEPALPTGGLPVGIFDVLGFGLRLELRCGVAR